VKATLPVTPTKIKLTAGNDTLLIEWSDGHLSAYPYRYLRDKCPCANCSEARARTPSAGSLIPIFGAKPLRPERAELVGRYAVQIYWTDSHSAGIYSFAFLRELCPCAECMVKGKDTSGA